MTTAKENELMTVIAPGSAAGALLRRYWQPAALAEELDDRRPLVPVRLMGEDLVLFRDEQGHLGLLDRHCPHRGADLCFGRLENGGLRCAFHGWLFDTGGQCIEQPGEPVDSHAHRHLRHRAYPCAQRNGIVFAYLGDGAPPAFPAFDCFQAPAAHTFAFKGWWDCNWLQALEVGIDPVHTSFLHRFHEDESLDGAYGRQFRADAAGAGVPLTKLMREQHRPSIQLEDTAYGFRVVTTRPLRQGETHYRITNLVFPNAIVIPMSAEMTITQWHVPIDDENCYWYSLFTSFGDPVDRDLMRSQRLQHHSLPEYRPKLGRSSNWGYDREDQVRRTYTGLGLDVNVQDQWAVESPGRIHNRAREHLGTTDVAIVKYRKLLMQAIRAVQAGDAAPFVPSAAEASRIRGPIALDAVGPERDQGVSWQQRDRERRARSSWARVMERP